MIGKIKGKLQEIHNNKGYVETSSGVTYQIHILPHFLDQIGKEIELYTHLQVKDDDLVLFGFATHAQYWLYQQLISVDGVGPKSGFAILSYGDYDQIITAIESNDVYFFQSVPGIGKKTASRIILDLSGKLAKQVDVETLVGSTDDKTVIEALVTLGFAEGDIRKHLRKVDKAHSLEEKIRELIVLISG